MSDKRKEGVIITMKGLQLITKLAAGVGALEISAVKVGTGILPEDTDPLTMDDVISYKMDGVIADFGYDSDTKNGYVMMQLSNDGLENGFVMTEIGLYAIDPDLGEILYAYVDMSDDPNYIMPAENGRHKLVQMKLHVIVDGTQGITAVINPAAQITKEVFDQEIQNIVTPDFDDSGEAEGIGSFSDFMTSFVKGTSIYKLLENLKAGLKYVLHAGQLVNNGLCETPGQFPLDAAYGKELTDQITGLYSDLGGFEPIIDETGKITGYKTTVGGADTVFPFSEVDKNALLEALSASGLNINADSTPEEIYAELKRAFPGNISSALSLSRTFKPSNSDVVSDYNIVKMNFYGLAYNLTGIKKLTFSINWSYHDNAGSGREKYLYNGCNLYVGVGLSKTGFSKSNYKVVAVNDDRNDQSGSFTIELDVSSLTGNYYIGIGMNGGNMYKGLEKFEYGYYAGSIYATVNCSGIVFS